MTIKEFELEINKHEKVAVGDLVDLYTPGVPGYRESKIMEVSEPVYTRNISGWPNGTSVRCYMVTGKVRLLDMSEYEHPDFPGTKYGVSEIKNKGK